MSDDFFVLDVSCLKMQHILLLSMSLKKIPTALKIDQYKDGCHLKHWGGGGGRYACLSVWVSLSLLFLIMCVCSMNIHDACLTFILQHVNSMTP